MFPPYQFINAEITYCCNYWHMYESLIIRNGCDPKLLFLKTVFPCRLLLLVAGKSFFQGTVLLYFTQVTTAIHSSMDTVFFRRVLVAMNFVYAMYLTGIWKVLNQFAIPDAATHSINGPFSFIKEQFQPRILSNLLWLCRTRVLARRCHSY